MGWLDTVEGRFLNNSKGLRVDNRYTFCRTDIASICKLRNLLVLSLQENNFLLRRSEQVDVDAEFEISGVQWRLILSQNAQIAESRDSKAIGSPIHRFLRTANLAHLSFLCHQGKQPGCPESQDHCVKSWFLWYVQRTRFRIRLDKGYIPNTQGSSVNFNLNYLSVFSCQRRDQATSNLGSINFHTLTALYQNR